MAASLFHHTTPLVRLALALCATGAWGYAAGAQTAPSTPEATAWEVGTKSQVRLVAAGALEADGRRVLRAGVEVELKPGWKTYWRYPGDSGIAPRFDFSRSENVKDVRVLWPAPVGFSDGGGKSIGYGRRVLFPLGVTPADATKPVHLRLQFEYGVCEKLCVPVDAKLALELGAGATAFDAVVAESEARVPVRKAVGEGGPLAIVAARRVAENGKDRVIVDIAAPQDAKVDLFAEGPTPDWALPLPAPISRTPDGHRRFAFDLDGLPPGVSAAGAHVTLTATSGQSAIEVSVPLD